MTFIRKCVIINLFNDFVIETIGAVAHLARALQWHCRGSGFKSHQLQYGKNQNYFACHDVMQVAHSNQGFLSFSIIKC